MSGSFYGLEISKTGLFASRSAINTTGHNISNANTEGYTRQRVSLESIEPYYANERFLGNYKGEIGGGVDTAQIEQIRSVYLDDEIRRENADMGFWSVVSSELEYVEKVMDEMSDSSISQSLADFYESLNNLSQNPESSEIRTIVVQEGVKLTQTINHTYDQLVEVQNVMNESINVTAGEINAKLEKVYSYNEKIVSYELGGQRANDLRDKRNLVLDKLSELVSIEYEEDASGNVLVSIPLNPDDSGPSQEMVTATSITKIGVDTGVNPDHPEFYTLYYGEDVANAAQLSFSGGELEGYTHLRDEEDPETMGIPKIMDELNTLASEITAEFNTVHNNGFTLYSDPLKQHAYFFEVPASGVVTAENMAVSDDILKDINLIAASSETVTSKNNGNNENALALLGVTTKNISGLNDATFEDYIESMVVNIAIDAGYSNDMNDAQGNIVQNIEDRRQSVSGVSLDEEMSNLVKFQYAYSASARMITVVDESLDKLINGTGLVGR